MLHMNPLLLPCVGSQESSQRLRFPGCQSRLSTTGVQKLETKRGRGSPGQSWEASFMLIMTQKATQHPWEAESWV